ncbi:MAG TPA: polysaccharide deacetylase family protein [Flavisolibacter sp.]|jgi:peptidoglycan/xylan/chitin deacetylase (PgdA/CDA1 family)|nr:polysaccharide deacetylase family protein [Flavisolibacter sp.]
MKNRITLLSLALAALISSCSNQSETTEKKKAETAAPADSSKLVVENKKEATAAEIMARKQVPVLCYHHIRDIQMVSKASKGYEVTVAQFKDQMKALADSGYHTILPDQLYDYLVYGKALPEKPVMLTYDDTDEEQFSVAKAEMDKYGFKGVYFIMTISIGRPRYMSKEQIKQLSDEGHVIASHTWDHHRVDRLTGEDWFNQFDKPKKQLEAIVGKPVEYFAYPFGIWNEAAIPEIKKRDFKLSFQLSTKRDSLEPLHTVRRMIVSPEWSAPGVIKVMKSTFK